MRRKKAEELPAGAVTLPAKHGGEAAAEHSKGDSESAGVIDLDLNTVTVDHTAEPPTVKVEGDAKPKRKYTRRTRKVTGTIVTPTFIDRDELRSARIQVFTEYIDGKCTFERASAVDSRLKELDGLASALNKDFEIKP